MTRQQNWHGIVKKYLVWIGSFWAPCRESLVLSVVSFGPPSSFGYSISKPTETRPITMSSEVAQTGQHQSASELP